MNTTIFRDGTAHGLIRPMYEAGYAIEKDCVDPEFANALLQELKREGMYHEGGARLRGEPGVYHDSEIFERLQTKDMPLLREYRNQLDSAITDVSGFRRTHLTYLTVRVCPVDEMSSRIHRNDRAAGPWLITLTAAGSGSFNVYPQETIDLGEEIEIDGSDNDPTPLAGSEMKTGGAWGIYSREASAPHAGGMNTSRGPKVLIMLYGWYASQDYPYRESFQFGSNQ